MYKGIKVSLIFIMAAGWALCAMGEVSTFKSALIWSIDEGADYKLDELSTGTYTPREIIAAAGEIKSITASWKFEGKVTLEISADGGVHYSSVVCGVPLTEGFVRGNKLRWRANIAGESRLKEVKIIYTDTSGVVTTFGEPALSGFEFRKPIYIMNPSGEELFNYQINIKVGESKEAQDYHVHCGGNVKRNFVDIRFAAQDGETILCCYKEYIKGKALKRTASFWLKIPHLPKQGVSIYIYYGKLRADNISYNGRKVFEFFDDFKGDALDEDIWSIKKTEDNGNIKVADSQLTLEASELISRKFKFARGIVEYSAISLKGEESSLIVKSKPFMQNEEALEDEEAAQLVYSSGYKGAEHCIAVGGIVKVNEPTPILPNTTYNYRIYSGGKKIIFERYSEDFKEKQARVSLETNGYAKKGHIGLKSMRSIKEQSVTFYNWVRVRKYAYPEPYAVYREVKEEKCDSALFKGTALGSNGNLILKPFELGGGQTLEVGSYTSKKISSSFISRIIVPYWIEDRKQKAEGIGQKPEVKRQRRGIFVDISADNAKTYRRNCAKGAYYYASRKDFTAGRALRQRLNFYNIEGRILEIKEINLNYRPGKITIISPNGGENWLKGQRRVILWTAMDYEASYPLSIEYSADNGRSYLPIAKYTKNDGKFLWKLPPKLGKEAIIRISDALERNIYDISDSSFFINE